MSLRFSRKFLSCQKKQNLHVRTPDSNNAFFSNIEFNIKNRFTTADTKKKAQGFS